MHTQLIPVPDQLMRRWKEVVMRLTRTIVGLLLTAMLVGCAGTAQRSGKSSPPPRKSSSEPSIAREYDRAPAPRPPRAAISPAPVPPVRGISHTTSSGNIIRIGFQSKCTEDACGDKECAESSCDTSILNLHKKLCPIHKLSSAFDSGCKSTDKCGDDGCSTDGCSSQGCHSDGGVKGLFSGVWGRIKRANPFDGKSSCGDHCTPREGCNGCDSRAVAANLGCDPFANPEPEMVREEMPETVRTPEPVPTPGKVPAVPANPGNGAVPAVPEFPGQATAPQTWPRLKTRQVSRNDTLYTGHAWRPLSGERF